MKVQLDLPEFRVEQYTHHENGNVTDEGLCAGCGLERYGLMAKLHPVGWLHAEDEDGNPTCLQKAIDKLTAPDPATAWTTVARHVAKYPSRHDAATIRAVIRELLQLVEAKRGDAL
ncbi:MULTISPECIES: hypothetical protein [unclassified Streptomyces]|uniref:hypothetical protein n=1 Tax=unclassified Streptomyces TaxID=2593676 RepID=UPI00081F3783|nr:MULTISPECIES: hypothetical protein [unclassified Streptomyces]MYZ37507.1 hypothetical protein [Streptomyces sp. SID4917]SCF91849.1 hypothetical protein GA0115259_1048213 [Streptomyces sp. MnatMP-M17]